MLTILLMAAGETEYDGQGRIQGTLDVPLSDHGREQVLAAAEELAASNIELAALYSGPCRSARETAEIIAERLDLRIKTVDQFHNLDHGLWQGLLFDDVKAKQPKVYRQWTTAPETICPPQGETLQSALTRLEKALVKIRKKHKSGAVGVVLAQPMAAIMRSFLRKDHPPKICLAGCTTTPLYETIEAPAEV